MRSTEKIGWQISPFVYWFRPENRFWFWWKGAIEEENDGGQYLKVTLISPEAGVFPWEALRWLFLAAGAASFAYEDL